MKEKQWFSQMSDPDLLAWWQQYGMKAAFYRDAPRRAAYSEMKKRGIDGCWTYQHYPRQKGYSPNGNAYLKNWRLL